MKDYLEYKPGIDPINPETVILRILFRHFSSEYNDYSTEERLLLLHFLMRKKEESIEDLYINFLKPYIEDEKRCHQEDDMFAEASKEYFGHMLSADFDHCVFQLKLEDAIIKAEGRTDISSETEHFTLNMALEWLTYHILNNDMDDVLKKVVLKDPVDRAFYLIKEYKRVHAHENPVYIPSSEMGEDDAARMYLEKLHNEPADGKSRCIIFPHRMESLKREASEDYRQIREEFRDGAVKAIEALDIRALERTVNLYANRDLTVEESVLENRKYKKKYLYEKFIIPMDMTLFTDYTISDEKGSWTVTDRYWLDDKTLSEHLGI